MLKIKELHATLNNVNILKGINLDIQPGTIHVIMGPNGSGKSTLANILVGKENIDKISGTIEFYDKNLLQLAPEERAHLGLFLAFQYPIEIAGITNFFFLKTALNNLRKKNGLEELDAIDFTNLVKSKCKIIGLDDSFLQRPVNFSLSGGEKKRNEILQMLVLDPNFIILDEPDSGLDIDSLQIVANGINFMRNSNKSILLITHYQRLLNYVIPDYIHILYNGKIIKSGDKTLSAKLEKTGYSWIDSFKNDNTTIK